MKVLRQLGIIFFISSLLISCGTSGGGGDPTSSVISGTASKNLISGGTATAFPLNTVDGSLGSPIGTATTAVDGSFSIDIGTYLGNVLVEITGGTYTDEATGNTVTNTTLRAAVTGVTGNISVSVTPLTEIGVIIAGSLTQANIDAANALVSAMVGGFDITTTVPADVTNPSSATAGSNEQNYGFFLATISQMIFDGTATSVDDAIAQIANDLSDNNQLDSTGADISSSLDAFLMSDNNKTGLLLNGTNLDESINNATISPIESSLDITIDPTGTGNGSVTSNPTGIDCPGDCSEAYTIGASVTLTAAPESGSMFAGWSGACTGTGGCTVIMNDDMAVTAKFDIIPPDPLLNVTIDSTGTGIGTVTSNPGGIDCGVDCNESYAFGSSVVLTAIPDTGSMFASWSGACTGTGGCTVIMNDDMAVTAKFDIIPPDPILDITIDSAGTGNGTITSNPVGINCEADCSEDYTIGTSVVLTAMPDTGSMFVEWTGACTGTGGCTVTMNADMSVTAKFDLIPPGDVSLDVTIDPTGTGNGSVTSNPTGIDCPGVCSEVYTDGTSVTLTAAPDSGSMFVEWTGACAGTGGCTVNMNADLSVTAKFDLAPLFLPDIAGTWYLMDIKTPQKDDSNPDLFGFDFDKYMYQSDGTGTITCIKSSFPCGPPPSDTSVTSISSEGIVTVPLGPNEENDIVMGQNKDIIVGIFRGDNNDEQSLFSLVKRANSYSMADLEGTWYEMGIQTPQKGFSDPSLFGFNFGTVTLENDGTGTYTCGSESSPCGPPEQFEGVAISSEGIITMPPDPLFPNDEVDMVMGKNKDILLSIFRENNLGNENRSFGILVKKADSYSMADLVGTWYSMEIATPLKGFSDPHKFGFGFSIGTFQSDGTGTGTCIRSSFDDPCGPPITFSGISISPDGIVTFPLGTNNERDIVMGKNKDIMVQILRQNSVENKQQNFSIFVKTMDQPL